MPIFHQVALRRAKKTAVDEPIRKKGPIQVRTVEVRPTISGPAGPAAPPSARVVNLSEGGGVRAGGPGRKTDLVVNTRTTRARSR